MIDEEDKAIFKFNNGNGALLCSNCRTIIKTGIDFTEEEWKAMKGELQMRSRWCQECLDELILKYPII